MLPQTAFVAIEQEQLAFSAQAQSVTFHTCARLDPSGCRWQKTLPPGDTGPITGWKNPSPPPKSTRARGSPVTTSAPRWQSLPVKYRRCARGSRRRAGAPPTPFT
jgi:hypothetical protein